MRSESARVTFSTFWAKVFKIHIFVTLVKVELVEIVKLMNDLRNVRNCV